MSEQEREEMAALKARVADLEAKLAQALAVVDDYSKVWEHYDATGEAPPRRCELEAARNSGETLDTLLAEFAEIEKRQRREGAA